MIVKLISLVTAIVLGIPVGGVYASADSPSKYLNRLTSASSSEGMEDKTPATVSRAVMGAHGVILNTVDRNANRLEYVASESYDVVKETKDKVNPGSDEAKIQDTDAGVGVDSSKRAVVNDFNDVSVQSLDWPEGGFTGESTITYDVNGKGSFEGGATTNAVTTKYDGFKDVTKYAHTDNLDDAGGVAQNGGYGNNKSYSRVVTIPGASSLTVTITYQTESTNWDWVCAYAGGTESSPAGNNKCSTSLTGKLGGTTKTTKSFTVDGDSVTFWFKSDGGGSNYYGYYAVVKGLVGSKESVSGTYAAPVDPSGEYKFSNWNTKPDGTGENLSAGEVYSPSSQTVYAQWELGPNYTKWGTVGWKITDDGTLKIRPWEGNTGTTGSVTSYSGAPWYNQRSQIKKVESTGNIVLNANSVGLFYNCSNLTDITALASWDVSHVTDMSSMFGGCSKLTDFTPIALWNISNVTSMRGIFSSCSSLTDLTPLADWNMSKVTDMRAMFLSCSKLTDLTPIAHWNVSKVTNMGQMFSYCSSLTDLTPLAHWNVSNVTRMDFMFSYCSSLTDLTTLAHWNVSNVTRMDSMFASCSSLTDLTALKDWNMSKVTDMYYMFSGCSKIQKVGIPSIANGGQKLVSRASQSYLNSYMPTIISGDFTLGPYSWSQLNSEMQTNPDAFQDGTIWVKYTPSWMVTYNANGGVSSMPGSMTPVNQLLTLPESSFLRFGYKFTGWTTQPSPVSDTNTLMKPGQIFNPSDKTDGKKYTLYAQWEKIGDTGDLPSSSQSGMIPGWIQVDSNNTKADITPNQSQSAVFTNKYDPGSTSIQFKFTKLMDGNVPDSGESFQFELFSVSENKVIQTTTNTGASVQFQPITYNKAGTYTYYVRESESNSSNNVNDDPNLDYDNHLVEAAVTVTEEEDPTSPSGKKLKATAQVTGDTIFRNDSKPASIDISKTVTGVTEGMNDNHRDREFTFNVNLLDRDNQPVSDKTYPTTITNNGESGGNTSPSTSSITFDATGNATIKLKAGSKLTINGIPAYYKYTITETNIPTGYKNISLTNPSGILGANSHVTVDAVNHYTVTPASASLQVGKILLAPGGLNQSVNNGEFQFALCQVVPLTIGLEAGPNVESCSGVSETSNDGNGLVTFPQLTYDAPGTYQYQIREVKGDTLDMTYDSTVYTVTVKVTDDGAGRLVAKVTYTNTSTGDSSTPGPGSKPVWNSSDPNEMGVPVFVNRTTVANRLPVTGGPDIIIAGVVLAMILSCGLMVFLNRGRREE